MRLLVLPLLLPLLTATVAWADDVSVVVKNGKLAVKGDADANTVSFVGEPGDTIRVTASGGTTLNGGAGELVVGGVTEGASFSFGNGADVVLIDSLTLPGKVTIKMGKGSDRLTIDEVTLTGPAKLDFGGGDDSLAVCTATIAKTSVKFGKGTGGAVAAACGGDLVTSSNASALAMLDVTTTGDLAVKAAAGVNIGVIDDVRVDGKLTLGKMALLALCYGDVNGGLTAKMPKIVGNAGGAVSCVGGVTEAFANGNTAIAMAGFIVDGPFTVKGGAGDDTVVLTGTGIDEGTSLNLGGGFNFLFFDLVQTASFLAKAGKASDDLFADQLTVLGDATVKYGAGDNVIELTASSVTGDLTIKTGAGNDHITTINNTVGGTQTIDAGKGADTLDD